MIRLNEEVLKEAKAPPFLLDKIRHLFYNIYVLPRLGESIIAEFFIGV